jgi:hypothetical protein
MKHNKIFGLLMAVGLAGLVSCNDDATTTATNNDSVPPAKMDNTMNNSSAVDYSAFADDIEKNGTYYANPRTGKKYTKLTVNRNSGEIMDENNQPVYRYVDTRNWWVYGLDDEDWTWGKMGEAKMDKEQLMYKDDSGKWVDYDTRWKMDDANFDKSWKSKSGDVKIKFGKDGDIKVKDKNGTTKYDADDNKIKTDSSHN